MTNYNERLDEILDWGQAARAEADIVIRGLDTSNGSYVQERLGEIRLSHKNKAKQAHTSLIKELVAEAKPKTMPSNLSPENYEKCERVVNQYHQNLLKALEAVSATPTPNNQDDELIDILWELIRHAKNPHDRENKFHSMPEAKAAILAWHNKQLEQAMPEKLK